MKKAKILIVLVISLFIVVGCGNSNNNSTEENQNNTINQYVQNSRKSAYVDIAIAYVDAIRNKVNEAAKIKLFSTDTLYLIPVGHVAEKSCISVETGGQSPFSDEWNYAYVGVTYTGQGYKYYFIGEDGEGNGLPFLDQKTLADTGINYLYDNVTDNPDANVHDTLTKLFVKSSYDLDNLNYTYEDISLESLASKVEKTKVQVIRAGKCSNL